MNEAALIREMFTSHWQMTNTDGKWDENDPVLIGGDALEEIDAIYRSIDDGPPRDYAERLRQAINDLKRLNGGEADEG